MRTLHSKTKNLEIYQQFLNYSKPINVPIDVLAKKFRCHKNKIISLLGCAQRYDTIYLALIDKGFPDATIPTWFRRPDRTTNDDRTPINANRYTVNAEQEPRNAQTLNHQATTLKTPVPKALYYLDNLVIPAGAERRSSSLSIPAVKPQSPYELIFDQKPISINARILQTTPPTPLEMELSELDIQIRRKNNEFLKKYEERNQQRYEDLLKKIIRSRRKMLNTIGQPYDQQNSSQALSLLKVLNYLSGY